MKVATSILASNPDFLSFFPKWINRFRPLRFNGDQIYFYTKLPFKALGRNIILAQVEEHPSKPGVLLPKFFSASVVGIYVDCQAGESLYLTVEIGNIDRTRVEIPLFLPFADDVEDMPESILETVLTDKKPYYAIWSFMLIFAFQSGYLPEFTSFFLYNLLQ